ncbi:hypothetical protein [Limosilactobacillus fermentum]
MLTQIIHYFQLRPLWAAWPRLVLSFSGLSDCHAEMSLTGYLGSKHPKVALICSSFSQVLRIIPSLGLLFLLIPLIGTGVVPAGIALVSSSTCHQF